MIRNIFLSGSNEGVFQKDEFENTPFSILTKP